MNKNDLLIILKDALKAKADILESDSTDTVAEWDSLAQLQILMSLDERTDGKASEIPELAIALSVKAIWETLEANGLVND